MDCERGFEESNISTWDTIAQIWNGLCLKYRQNLPGALISTSAVTEYPYNLVPQILDCYVWMKSVLKLDPTTGQSICLALCRQTGICSAYALNHLDTPNWCKGFEFPKALCSALAELEVVLAWNWGGARTGLGSPAPLSTLPELKGKTEQENPKNCSPFSTQILHVLCVFKAAAVMSSVV